MSFLAQLTTEAQAHIEQAHRVFMALGNAAMVQWILQRHPDAEPLEFYREEGPDPGTVSDWNEQVAAAVDRVLRPVRAGEKVCVVLDGHPAIQTPPVHTLVRQARDEGLEARFLPGISAEATLYCDLSLDPAREGWQSFEATDFLVRRRPFSTGAGLLLRQIGLIGEFALVGRRNDRGLAVLAEVLAQAYGAHHEAVLYEASPDALQPPLLDRVALADLPKARVNDLSTLYVPPLSRPPIDAAMLDRLGIPPQRIRDE